MAVIGVVGGCDSFENQRYIAEINRQLPTHEIQFIQVGDGIWPAHNDSDAWDKLMADVVDAAQKLVSDGACRVVITSAAIHRREGMMRAALGEYLVSPGEAIAVTFKSAQINSAGVIGSSNALTILEHTERALTGGLVLRIPPPAVVGRIDTEIDDLPVAVRESPTSREALGGVPTELAEGVKEAIDAHIDRGVQALVTVDSVTSAALECLIEEAFEAADDVSAETTAQSCEPLSFDALELPRYSVLDIHMAALKLTMEDRLEEFLADEPTVDELLALLER